MSISEFFYKLKCKYIKKYQYHLVDLRNKNYKHDTLKNYDYGYLPHSERILYASFAVLVDFVENEKVPQNQISYILEAKKKNNGMYIYGSEEEDAKRFVIYQSILDLYDWWTISMPQWLHDYDKALHEDSLSNEVVYYKKYKKSIELENFINQEKVFALKKLASLIEYM